MPPKKTGSEVNEMEEEQYPGKAKIDGADVFYSDNQGNKDFVDNFFKVGEQGTLTYGSFMPTNPADMGRLYRYDPEKNELVRDFFDREGLGLAEDPALFYDTINTFDLSRINTQEGEEPTYFYFRPGESDPRVISGKKDILLTDAMLPAGSPIKAALDEISAERRNMSPEEKQREIELQQAQTSLYSSKRASYDNAMLFGSNISDNRGTEHSRNFVEEINRHIVEENADIDFDYHTSNERLTEDDIVAMTMLSFGNPDVTGDAYEGYNPVSNSMSSIGMWAQDLGIERSGKTGTMLEPLKKTRIDAKKNVEAYDKSGDLDILADAVINGVVANSASLRNPDSISAAYLGNAASVSILNKFITKPELKARVFEKAKDQGKLPEIRGAYRAIQTQASIVDIAKEKNTYRIYVDTTNPEDPLVDEEEAANNRKALKVNDTILQLLNYEYNISTNQFVNVTTPAEDAETIKFAEKQAEARAIQDRDERSKKMNEAMSAFNADMLFAGKCRPEPGMAVLLGREGGADAAFKYLSENNIVLDENSTPEQIAKVHNQLSDAGLIPKMPEAYDEKSIRSYWSSLENYQANKIIANIRDGNAPDYRDPTVHYKDDLEVFTSRTAEALESMPAVLDVVPEKGYEGIRYDAEAVADELDRYITENPWASDKEREDLEKGLVGRSAIKTITRELYKKDHPDAGEAELSANEDGLTSIINYFGNYKGSDLAEQLRQYQSMALQMNSSEEYQKYVAKNLMPQVAAATVNAYDGLIHYGETQHKAFFAPVTDSSELFMDVIDSRTKASAKELMQAYQSEIDSVQINVPEGYSPKLMEYVVLGECLRPENILKTKDKAYGAGSTLPENFDVETNLQVFYFDNLLSNDERLNTQSMRSIVADCRKMVANYADTENYAQMNTCLQKAASAMYGTMMSCVSYESGMFRYAAMNLNQMLDLADKQGISLDDLGLNEKQAENIRFMKAKAEFAARRLEITKELSSKRVELYLNEDLPRDLDPTRNNRMYDLYVEEKALNMIGRQIYSEISIMSQKIYSQHDPRENAINSRDLTRTEKLMQKDPKALLDFYKMEVLSTPEYQEMMAHPEAKMDAFLNNGTNFDRDSSKHSGDPQLFEKAAADLMLKNLAAEADKQMQVMNAVSEGERSDGFADTYQMLQNIKNASENLSMKRSQMNDPSLDENLYALLPDYEQLDELITQFDEDADMEYNQFSMNVAMPSGGLSSQIKAIKDLKEQREYVKDVEERFADFANAGKTAFERNFERTKAAFDTSIKGRYKTGDVRTMLDSLDTLKQKLDDSRRADEKDMPGVSKAFKDALDSVNKCLENKKLNEDVRFLAEGLQKSLMADNELMKIANTEVKTEGKTFDQTITEARRWDSYGKLQQQSVRLQELRENLQSWSERFGGNSPSFQRFWDKFESMKVDQQGSVWTPDKKVIEDLAKAAKEYIGEKKYVPSTTKGKTRLDIIKEVRDICENMKPQLNKEAMQGAKAKAFNAAVKTSANIIREKMQTCVDKISTAWRNKDSAHLLSSVSELVYMQGLNDNKDKLAPNRLSEMLQPESVNKAVRDLKGVTGKVLSSINAKEFGNAVEKKTIGKFVESSFNKVMAQNTRNKTKENEMQKNADKADEIISKKPKNVGGVSL